MIGEMPGGQGIAQQSSGFGRGAGLPAPGYPLQGQPAAPMAGAVQSPMGPTQEDVFGLLKNNLLRRFKIDIETDSTVAGDESQEKQDRQGFIEAMTKFMEAWGPMVERKPELAPLAGQLLLFGVRAFRVGRELEEVIEETVDKLSHPDAMQKQPDAKVQAEQVKLQAAIAKTQSEIRKAQIDAQTASQAAQAKLQEIITESQAKLAELKMKLAASQQDHVHKQGEAQMAHAANMDKMQLEQQKAQTAAQQAKWPVDPSKDQGF
jgi:hypothetical protein